ncbi:hypothetical protein [Spiroplasma eriocheiris]|uniref:Uncharacterized protein n=1 Tax=Spiroplasma eriocheiris TaxID=315358 RepID=A0A0H3XJ34_9MOLU|nr:hypothetical protein [Spiroplasma eriocheiris]AHF57349.1 hypothetical protein SPE_0216 [Spiroplasma eriocheiris CCTCC M 207170]AKM53806.1 hypothetical protein SERIO_v1c02180 [Spiroplasma eriocheiris]
MNEYELLYLYQDEHNEKALLNLYKIYCQKLETSKRRTYHKYFSLPVELEDLETIKYFSIMKSAQIYNPTSKKKLSDFIEQRFIWDIHNYLRKHLNSKNYVLNGYLKMLGTTNFDQDNAVNLEQDLLEAEALILIKEYLLTVLSPLEKKVFLFWIRGYNIRVISHELGLTYRQVDNAQQRIMKKIRDFSKNNASWV